MSGERRMSPASAMRPPTMGAGLPSAIMASLLYPERRVMAVCGDGGFMMNSQELETAGRLKLNLVVMILNDLAFGMIRWKQAVDGFPDFGSHIRQSRLRPLRRVLWRQGIYRRCGRGSRSNAGGGVHGRWGPLGRTSRSTIRRMPVSWSTNSPTGNISPDGSAAFCNSPWRIRCAVAIIFDAAACHRFIKTGARAAAQASDDRGDPRSDAGGRGFRRC